MNIVLVEDLPALRETFARMVEAMPGHRLVAAFPTAEEAMQELRPGMADLLVVDLDLPGQGGIEFIRWLQDSPLQVPAVVWTIHEGREAVYAALKAGAVGYLAKGAKVHEFHAALDGIAEGGAPMSPRIARRLVEDLLNPVAPLPPAEDLSVREREVIRAVARGETPQGDCRRPRHQPPHRAFPPQAHLQEAPCHRPLPGPAARAGNGADRGFLTLKTAEGRVPSRGGQDAAPSCAG